MMSTTGAMKAQIKPVSYRNQHLHHVRIYACDDTILKLVKTVISLNKYVLLHFSRTQVVLHLLCYIDHSDYQYHQC